MQAHAYWAFVDALRTRLESDPRVVGLVLLGSTADQSHAPDEYSDHDFFVITTPGAQEYFRNQLEWLPDHESIVLAVRETQHGLKILYASGHILEFAAFDMAEIGVATVNDYAIAIDRGGVTEAVQRVVQPESVAEHTSHDRTAHEVGMFLCLLVVGAGRVARGEAISGQVFIRTYALSHLLRALTYDLFTQDRATLDSLDVFRRFERAFPEAGAAINAALSGEPISAALGLLDVCEQQLGNAAAFPRAAAETVRRFLGRLAARV